MKRILLPVLAGSLLGVVGAQETPPVTPFFENPTELRHAYAVDLVGLYLDIAELGVEVEVENADEAEEAGAGDLGAEETEAEEEAEEEEGLLETALPLMAGSLAAADAALLSDLEAVLVEDAPAENARELLAQAEGLLVPEALRAEPTFKAARLALLASLEPGVGEGYEEAAQGETEAYYIGYTGLQRIAALWEELQAELDGDPAEVNRAFGVLEGLMPSAELPERFSNPEDAEVAVNDVIFGLETLSGATLLPRDFAGMLDAVGSHVTEGCSAAEAGNTQLALEWTTAAAFFYDAYLVGTLETLAPEPNARISEELGELVEEPDSEQTPSRCENLSAAFAEASSVFGG